MSESSALSIFHIILSYPKNPREKRSNVNLVTNAIAVKTTHLNNMARQIRSFPQVLGLVARAPDPVIGEPMSLPLTGGPVITPGYPLIFGNHGEPWGAHVTPTYRWLRGPALIRIQVTAVHCGLDPRNSPMPSHRKRCSGEKGGFH